MFMSQIVLYFLRRTSVLSFQMDVVLTLSIVITCDFKLSFILCFYDFINNVYNPSIFISMVTILWMRLCVWLTSQNDLNLDV